MTIFPEGQNNRNIATGEWNPLNMQVQQFCLAEPIRTINERCTEENMSYKDKSLGLWKIPEILENNRSVRLMFSEVKKKLIALL
jgi:hypothetical protein